MKQNNYRSRIPLDPLQAALDKMEFLAGAEIDPSLYVAAEMSDVPGFELGALGKGHLNTQAVLNIARAKERRPPRVPKEYAIPIGIHPRLGFPVELNFRTLGSVGIFGAPYSGKNYAGYKIGQGILKHKLSKVQFQLAAQKGDEANAVNLWPNSIYVPIQKDLWNDWEPIGADRYAYWIAISEALGIPKEVDVRTRPELPTVVEQMWRSAPHASWADIARGLRFKQKQPEGRDKHGTAAAVVTSYAAWMGDRAYVQVGADIRQDYQSIVRGYVGADLENVEASLGIMLVGEQFEARQRGHSRTPRLYLFIPEGLLLFSRDVELARRGSLSYLTRLAIMGSSMGIYLMVASQSMSRMSPTILNIFDTVIATRQDNPDEAALCARRLGLGEEAIPELMSLPLRHAYAKQADWDHAVLTLIDKIELGDSLPHETLMQRFSNDYDKWNQHAQFADRDELLEPIDWKAFGNQSRPRSNIGLLEEHYQFLRDIRDFPPDGLRSRYNRLGWGIEKGNRRLGELKAAGCLQVKEIPSFGPHGGRARRVPYLTTEGRQMLVAYETRTRP